MNGRIGWGCTAIPADINNFVVSYPTKVSTINLLPLHIQYRKLIMRFLRNKVVHRSVEWSVSMCTLEDAAGPYLKLYARTRGIVAGLNKNEDNYALAPLSHYYLMHWMEEWQQKEPTKYN